MPRREQRRQVEQYEAFNEQLERLATQQVGRPGSFQRGAVGMGRGVQAEHFTAHFPNSSDFMRQAPGVSGENDRQLGIAAVRPIRSGSLGIEVDHGRVAPGRGGSEGQMQGESGFPRTAFLAADGDGFHWRIVNTTTFSQDQECTGA